MAEDSLNARSAAGSVPVIPHWAGRYVGIPFREDGADFSGCNCWGLVRLVLEREAQIVVPAYADVEASDLRGAALAFSKAAHSGALFLPVVGSPAMLDVALMYALDSKSRRLPGHCGIMVSARYLLHVAQAHHAVIVPIDDPMIRHKIIGFFRHRDLCRSQ